MQKIATKVFIYASIAFGLIGILMVIVVPPDTPDGAWPSILFLKLLQTTVFIILPSFALSIAGKYLDGKFLKLARLTYPGPEIRALSPECFFDAVEIEY